MVAAKSSKIIGILVSLIVVLYIGLSISVAGQYNSKDQVKGRDGHCIAYACGVVYDTKAGLEWAISPNMPATWDQAKQYAENLTVAGGGWRMPTIDELKTLYEKGRGTHNKTPLLGPETSRWYVWSGETKNSSQSWTFSFSSGNRDFHSNEWASSFRAFAVRSRK